MKITKEELNEELKALIKIGLVKETKPGYYALNITKDNEKDHTDISTCFIKESK